ncbi:putative protein SERP1457 [Talaromyces islandicus]|uniref:6-phosphogluconolactonase n=1 Tax=Talaromyces islandicus TaxID=28573 RepID=A0A0U1LN87_TALIS|nr:putative protein SERP1457 [Talaromyces islandicus]
MHVLSRLAAALPLATTIWAFPTSTNTSSPSSTLYVSHYDGHVYTLSLDTAARSLTLAGSLQACGAMPSWVTYDAPSNTLYCVDESGSSANSGNGTLSSFSPTSSSNVPLRLTDKTTTLPGGVASVIYKDNDGRDYLAIAHYEGSAVSNFKLPLSMSDNPTALQTFEFSLPGPPTDPSRQDAPHPHETFLDPTGAYVLTPDLGSDVIHIFAIDKATGKLNECDAFAVKPGNGPRHGAWWTSKNKKTNVLYISNELANTVSTYTASYGDECLVLKDDGDIVPYPTDVPSSANIAEVRVADNRDVYVSVRNDQSFAPSDSMAFLQASADDGSLTYKNLTTSYGKTPRTFVVNKAGTLLAIGNQATSDVAIVERDPKTGALGDLVAQLQVGATGTPGQSDGLSSVIWAE